MVAVMGQQAGRLSRVGGAGPRAARWSIADCRACRSPTKPRPPRQSTISTWVLTTLSPSSGPRGPKRDSPCSPARQDGDFIADPVPGRRQDRVEELAEQAFQPAGPGPARPAWPPAADGRRIPLSWHRRGVIDDAHSHVAAPGPAALPLCAASVGQRILAPRRNDRQRDGIGPAASSRRSSNGPGRVASSSRHQKRAVRPARRQASSSASKSATGRRHPSACPGSLPCRYRVRSVHLPTV